MSNAVPWSTDVRTTGRPIVMLTPLSNASSFIGVWPWSWYMHTMASNRLRCTAWWNTVSAGCGPLASMPSARAASIAAQKPLLAVNHLEAHALTARLTDATPFDTETTPAEPDNGVLADVFRTAPGTVTVTAP